MIGSDGKRTKWKLDEIRNARMNEAIAVSLETETRHGLIETVLRDPTRKNEINVH